MIKATAWLIWLVAVAAAVAAVTFGYAEQSSGRSIIAQTLLSYLAGAAVAVVYASVGLALVRRMPRLPIGWIFLGIGAVAGFSDVTWAYALLDAARGRPLAPIDGTETAWAANAILPSAWFILATALVLLFPDGRPISRRWLLVLAAAVVGGGILVACLAVLPGPLLYYSFRDNPHAAVGWLGSLTTLLTPGILVFMTALTVSGAWSLRLRYLGAAPVEREQLKWFVWASALLVTAAAVEIGLGALFPIGSSRVADFAWLIFTAAAMTVPVAALIAILRYRLYDIDRLISRTFVYGALTAILAGLYAASIRLFTALFVGVTGQSSDAALILTTLVLATSFTPIKQRLETVAGERFRAVADPATPAPDDKEFDERVARIARRVAREVMRDEISRADRAHADGQRPADDTHAEAVKPTSREGSS